MQPKEPNRAMQDILVQNISPQLLFSIGIISKAIYIGFVF